MFVGTLPHKLIPDTINLPAFLKILRGFMPSFPILKGKEFIDAIRLGKFRELLIEKLEFVAKLISKNKLSIIL